MRQPEGEEKKALFPALKYRSLEVYANSKTSKASRAFLDIGWHWKGLYAEVDGGRRKGHAQGPKVCGGRFPEGSFRRAKTKLHSSKDHTGEKSIASQSKTSAAQGTTRPKKRSFLTSMKRRAAVTTKRGGNVHAKP